MTQDAMFVKIRINMKSYYDFYGFQYCVFFIPRIQLCDTKIGRPKKIAGNLSDPKNSVNFVKPRKIGLGQISNPKNRTSIPV